MVAESPREREFRVMVFPRRGGWYAECIDLNLVVARPTPEAALAALQEQIALHVATVLEEQLSEDLLHRPAPLSHRLRYLLLAVVDKMPPPFHTPHTARLLRLGVHPAAHA